MERGLEHSISVKGLRELLTDSRLRDDDTLIPNAVENLAVYRDNKLIAAIELLEGYQAIEWYEDQENSDGGL